VILFCGKMRGGGLFSAGTGHNVWESVFFWEIEQWGRPEN
jgi:hypothetical protein